MLRPILNTILEKPTSSRSKQLIKYVELDIMDSNTCENCFIDIKIYDKNKNWALSFVWQLLIKLIQSTNLICPNELGFKIQTIFLRVKTQGLC